MKEVWSVELEATEWADDTFTGTLEECREYVNEYGYTGDECRFAKILLDEDGCVAECLEILEVE